MASAPLDQEPQQTLIHKNDNRPLIVDEPESDESEIFYDSFEDITTGLIDEAVSVTGDTPDNDIDFLSSGDCSADVEKEWGVMRDMLLSHTCATLNNTSAKTIENFVTSDHFQHFQEMFKNSKIEFKIHVKHDSGISYEKSFDISQELADIQSEIEIAKNTDGSIDALPFSSFYSAMGFNESNLHSTNNEEERSILLGGNDENTADYYMHGDFNPEDPTLKTPKDQEGRVSESQHAQPPMAEVPDTDPQTDFSPLRESFSLSPALTDDTCTMPTLNDVHDDPFADAATETTTNDSNVDKNKPHFAEDKKGREDSETGKSSPTSKAHGDKKEESTRATGKVQRVKKRNPQFKDARAFFDEGESVYFIAQSALKDSYVHMGICMDGRIDIKQSITMDEFKRIAEKEFPHILSVKERKMSVRKKERIEKRVQKEDLTRRFKKK